MTKNESASLHDALIRLGPDYEHADWARYDAIADVTSAPDAAVIALIRPYAVAEVNLDEPEAWVPIHAWRIAACRRLLALIEPMLRVADHPDDNRAYSEFPNVSSMLGPAAIDILGNILMDRQRSDVQRVLAAQGLEAIAKQSSQQNKDRSIGALTRQIENRGSVDGYVNAFAARALIALKAISAREIVLAAYRDGRISLGLPDEEELKRVFGNPDG